MGDELIASRGRCNAGTEDHPGGFPGQNILEINQELGPLTPPSGKRRRRRRSGFTFYATLHFFFVYLRAAAAARTP